MVFEALTKSEVRRHIPTWILITIFLYVLEPVSQPPIQAQVIGTLIVMINYIFAYYVVGTLLMPTFWERSYWWVGIAILGLWAFFCGMDYLTFYHVIPSLGGGNIYIDFKWHKIVVDSTLIYSVIAFSAASFFFKKQSIKKIQSQNQREQSLMLKELNFLKNQFNSHITFNFLNYCYSHIHQHSEEAAEAIESFSNMLRYTLKVKPDEKIFLKDEIDYIKDFIELQKLLSSDVAVCFKSQGQLNGKKILPRILITFVENAFKHGQTNDQNNPIKIHLEATREEIKFTVNNRKNNQKRVLNTGVGKNNVKQVLDLFYKGKYQLEVDENESFYTTNLTLNTQ